MVERLKNVHVWECEEIIWIRGSPRLCVRMAKEQGRRKKTERGKE